MTSNSPNLNDHDFPNPGYLIICSGYQLKVNKGDPVDIPDEFTAIEINDRTNLDDENLDEPPDDRTDANNDTRITYDRLGRKHYRRTVYGPAVLCLRAQKFESFSAQTHANELAPILSARQRWQNRCIH